MRSFLATPVSTSKEVPEFVILLGPLKQLGMVSPELLNSLPERSSRASSGSRPSRQCLRFAMVRNMVGKLSHLSSGIYGGMHSGFDNVQGVPPEQRCVAKTSLYSCACAEPAESPWLTIRSAGWGTDSVPNTISNQSTIRSEFLRFSSSTADIHNGMRPR